MTNRNLDRHDIVSLICIACNTEQGQSMKVGDFYDHIMRFNSDIVYSTMDDMFESFIGTDLAVYHNMNIDITLTEKGRKIAWQELSNLVKYRSLVHYIANDISELSYEKVRWQRDDWKKRANKLIEENQND